MPDFQVRPARPEDLPAMQAVKHAAMADMLRRHGAEPPPAPTEVSPEFSYLLQHHGGGGFWVAEAGEQVIALASGILREGNWFLSNFWCRPDWQGRGLGRALARQLEPIVARAEVASVYSSPDPPAVATYLRLGMQPLDLILRLEAPTGLRLPPEPAWDGEVQAVPLAAAGPAGGNLTASGPEEAPSPLPLDGEMLAALGGIDRAVRGCRRDRDHQFLASQPGAHLQLYTRAGRPVAYSWVFASGRVGPLACLEAADVAPVLHAAVALGHELATGKAFLQVPGSNTAAVAWCLRHGLRLTAHRPLLASRPFGHLDRYVISGPALL